MNEEYYRVKVEQAPVTITKADGSTEVLEDLPPVTYGATKSAPRLRKRPRTIHANAKENSGKGEPNPKQ
jgi:hypothetical protein